MTNARFIFLGGVQWVALLIAIVTALVLVDVWAGHYRRGFIHRAQYAPLISGGLLVLCAIAAVVAPRAPVIGLALRAAGALAIVVGLIGFGLHHYYGVVRKPGGYAQWLNSLLYGAPPLAPLMLSALGAFALIAARAAAGATSFAGLSIPMALLALIVVCLFGAIVQAGLLHFRGAFNNPLMYAPLTVPVLTVIAGIWMVVAPGAEVRIALICLLWLTLLVGFVGLGMHLRGFDRQMAGLYVPLFNWLQGPPAAAPGLFAGLAAFGLVATGLLGAS